MNHLVCKIKRAKISSSDIFKLFVLFFLNHNRKSERIKSTEAILLDNWFHWLTSEIWLINQKETICFKFY